ncbi:MAG: TIGR04255 family protein [Planctomycetota bacterium]
MPVPESPRLIYQRNPLKEVICQVRFPVILRIDTERPVAFQEQLREQYPFYQEKPIVAEVPPELARYAVGPFGGTAYEFASADGLWRVSLCRDFMALSSRAYVRWEDFERHLDLPLRVLLEQYRPAFFSRVGLRYVDVIKRSGLGLSERPWAELLRPEIVGELGAADLRPNIGHAARELRLDLESKQAVMIRHGLANQGREECYVIDSDFYVEGPIEPGAVVGLLRGFSSRSGNLFRWCLRPILHEAMDPRSV